MLNNILRIDDPRDNLEKARRSELERFAKANGVKEINGDMPAILMRRILRQRGLINIAVPPRPLGGYQANPASPPTVTSDQGHEADMADDLARQWQEQNAKPDYRAMGRNELAAECKRRGIPMKRTDKTDDLRAKLNG